MASNRKRWLIALLAVVLVAGGYFAWQRLGSSNLPPGFATGNGRIEAVEIDIATKTPGRIRDILAREGDLIAAGQALAQMDTVQLEALHRQAQAQLRRATIGIETAKSLVTQRQAEKKAATGILWPCRLSAR